MKDYTSFQNLIKNRWDFVSICNLFPPQGGGLENASYQLLRFLSKEKGSRCLAFFSGDSNRYYREDDIDRVRLNTFKIFHGFYPLVGIEYILKLSKILKLNRKAIFIIYGRHFTGSIVSSILCKLYGVEYLYVDTGFEPRTFKSPIMNFFADVLDRTIFSLCYKFAKKHVFVSETSKKFVRSRYGKRVDEAKVILNGFEEDVISKYDGWEKEKIVVFASRLVLVKNPDTVVKAYLKLAPKYKDWQFYLIGKGSCLFDKMGEEEIPTNVNYVNELMPQEDFHKLLSRSAIYVNSSLSEGLPLSIVEAAALGCILVMSDIKHNMEVSKVSDLEKYSFPAKNLELLIGKLEKAMNDSTQKGNEFHKEIAKKNHEVFASKKIFAQYWQLIKDF
jgi:glycosyltransferase involved in cell wall biosynthesis